jgi:pyruvate-formate lyase-activating enzyme
MSNVFCNFPWVHNYVHPNGKFRLCCTTSQDIVTDDKYHSFHAGKHSVEEYWNSNRMKEIRKNMMNGVKVKDCIKCYQQDEAGVDSLRNSSGMNDLMAQTSEDGTFTKPGKIMQLQMTNICNLKCKMCSQMYSHMNGLELLEMGKVSPEWLLWVKEQGANVNNWTNELGEKQEWYKNEEYKLKMFRHISQNIEYLNVVGGEPTLVPEFYEMFEYCEKEGTLGNKSITLVTNLTNTNPKLIKYLPKLKKWKVWASIDGIGERTEYIRYPSKWTKVLESLDFYKDLANSSNGGITLSPAIQLLNIDQLDDIIKWWKSYVGGELNEKWGFTWLATVWYPLICNPNIAPQQWREKLADRLSNMKFDNFYSNFVNSLKKEELSLHKRQDLQRSFIRYNDAQDKFRGITKTWRDLCPELATAIAEEQKKV